MSNQPRNVQSLESVLRAFRDARELSVLDLERLVTNGANVGMTPRELLQATRALDELRGRFRFLR